MRLLLCQAPWLLPRASPQPVKIQPHKSVLPPLGAKQSSSHSTFLPANISLLEPTEQWQGKEAKDLRRTAVRSEAPWGPST
jgi:hypothetical protein